MQPLPQTEVEFRVDEWLWRPMIVRWKLILGFAIGSVCLTLLWQAIRTPTWVATTVVSPTNRESSDLASKLGRLGGVAALAGASLGESQAASEFDRFRFLLTSTRLAEVHVRMRNILPLVFAEDWDSNNQTWVRPTGPIQFVKDTLWPLFGLDPWLPPDARSVAEEYKQRLSQREIGKTGLVQISFRDDQPERAESILRYIMTDANELCRKDAAQQAESKARYLREQLSTATVSEYRFNLASLLATEEQTLMLTSTTLPFAAEIVQPIVTSKQPVSQRPLLYGLIALVIGTGLGVFIALIKGPIPKRDQPELTP